MTRDEMVTQLKDLAPFLHSVELPYGLTTTTPSGSGGNHGRRLQNLIDHIWPRMQKQFGGSLKGLRVLDVACNCGGFSFEAASSGASDVLGIDIVDRYIKQASFIKDAIGATNVHFEKISLDDLNPETHGMFDIVFCFGILYHLENPAASMRKIASVAKNVLVVDTNIMITTFDRPIWHMKISGGPKTKKDVTSLWRAKEGVCQFVPSQQAVVGLLQFLGFPTVEFLEPTGSILQEPRYREGRRGTFIAVRD